VSLEHRLFASRILLPTFLPSILCPPLIKSTCCEPAGAEPVRFSIVSRQKLVRSGGLRATYRMRMDDAREFDYARNVIYEALHEVDMRHNFPPVAHSLTTYTRKNLDQFLKDTTEMTNAYCRRSPSKSYCRA
jgi:hypothetical protein